MAVSRFPLMLQLLTLLLRLALAPPGAGGRGVEPGHRSGARAMMSLTMTTRMTMTTRPMDVRLDSTDNTWLWAAFMKVGG